MEIHEVARCKTIDGYFVKSIIGAKIVESTKVILRVQQLEGVVVVEVGNELNIKLKYVFILVARVPNIWGISR